MKYLIISALLVLAVSCGDSGTKAEETFTGITQTDEKGTILSKDAADWLLPKVSNNIMAMSQLSPAHPNPVSSKTVIGFALQESVLVKIELFSKPSVSAMLVMEGVMTQGQHEVQIDMSALANGIYRAYITIDNGKVKATTYGDIQKH